MLSALPEAAKEKTLLPWCADPAWETRCVGENSRHGFQLLDSTLRLGSSAVKTSITLGIAGTLYDGGIRSRCTSKERDSETRLDYFGARYYSNSLGSFLTPDWAAKPAAVPYAVLGDPQSLNLYSYVRNLPTSKLDTDGHGIIDPSAWSKLASAVGGGLKSFGIGVAKELHNMAANAASHMIPAVSEASGYTGMQTGAPSDPAKAPLLATTSNAMEGAGMITTKVAPLALAAAGAAAEGPEIVSVTNINTSVIHFTSDAGVDGITASSGMLRAGTYVTTPGEISAGSTSSQIENLLEIGPGKGTNSVTFETPSSNLTTPENGPTTSGGAQQFQLKEPTKIDPGTFKKTDPPQ